MNALKLLEDISFFRKLVGMKNLVLGEVKFGDRGNQIAIGGLIFNQFLCKLGKMRELLLKHLKTDIIRELICSFPF